jgi:hypothetical protein
LWAVELEGDGFLMKVMETKEEGVREEKVNALGSTWSILYLRLAGACIDGAGLPARSWFVLWRPEASF